MKKKLLISTIIVILPISLYYLDDYYKGREYNSLRDADSIQVEDISPRLRADKKFMQRLIIRRPEVLPYLDEDLKQDRLYMKKILSKTPQVLSYASDEVKNDREMVLAAINGMESLASVNDKFKKDKVVVMQALVGSGSELQYADESLKHDREVVLKAIERTPSALRYVAPELRKDKEIVLQAIKKEANTFQYADDSLRSDKVFNLEIHSLYPIGTEYAFSSANYKELGKDKEFMLKMMEINAYVYTFLDESLKRDPEIVAVLKRKIDTENWYYKKMNRIYKFDR